MPNPVPGQILSTEQRLLEQLGVRAHILAALRKEITGPSAPDEVLRAEDNPRLRYGAGILFPARVENSDQETSGGDPSIPATADSGNDDPTATDPLPDGADTAARSWRGGEADTEQEINRANQFLPSAIGLTVLLDCSRGAVVVEVSAGRYRHEKEPAREPGVHAAGGAGSWVREPIDSADTFEMPELLGSPPSGIYREITPPGAGPHLWVHLHVRSVPGHGVAPSSRMLTATLLNRTASEHGWSADEHCAFQSILTLRAVDGARFLEYPSSGTFDDTAEQASLKLLYRARPVFAVGHGCAPEWSSTPGDTTAMLVRTDTIPAFEVTPVIPNELEGVVLSMAKLGRDDLTALQACDDLIAGYQQWIDGQGDTLASLTLPPGQRAAGTRHLVSCKESLERMKAGLALIRSNYHVRTAFQLMNRAMLLQQEHYRVASQEVRLWRDQNGTLRLERPCAVIEEDRSSAKWRPFQLAFILVNLCGVADAESPDRETVDVIWFPTGGGKTEAYLGLTAFVMFLRRLRNPRDSGTAVLMRYTLRLLTTQQFQRAATLMCAAEMVRRGTPALGDVRFSIGLWVGAAVTPNKEADAVAALTTLLREGRPNPFQLLACPWCGAAMGPVRCRTTWKAPGYVKLPGPARVRFRCPDEACAFADPDGLPIAVIDEHIYKEPPSLIIGTVDKFALMPWKVDTYRLFGGGAPRADRPPDLIIQDELHLISGALGSMVGLYETVVDALTRDLRDRPAKVVASTATISRASEQVVGLYGGRPARLFPPPGLEAGDSFFAREAAGSPGRLYVGVFPSGLPSQQTAMIRVISALVQALPTAPTAMPEVLDPYWTLMAYFNSIRELGHAATLVRADIVEYLTVCGERDGLSPARSPDGLDHRRYPEETLELTSRVPGDEVSDALKRLFHPYRGAGSGAVDICLATNMIQVGLDVPRLGLMVVAGQPKTTSEYIQATSRVGRQAPGMVVTVFSPSKPRDRSHFEHFRAYHESIYRFVEPTSVTPFALPVRDRALHAVLIALARCWGGEGIARYPDPPPSDALVARIREVIRARVRGSDSSEEAEAIVKFDRIVREWRRLPSQRYGDMWGGHPDVTVPFMFPAGSEPLLEWQGRALSTPTSMRAVDAECNAAVITHYDQSD